MNVISFLLCVHVHAYIHSRPTADRRLGRRDRTFLGNCPVKDKNAPGWIFTSVVREEVNTGEVAVMVQSDVNNFSALCLTVLSFEVLYLSPSW